ncbi:MAG: RHS repeat-associated core domain-containing protein, partial [Ruminococcaceae bacterium]|nr:RHS repeat-associated core domain-containing protein [Oscillospiraceae bacterium]
WGNILSITNASGTDISGNATHIANLNPLRYRGYVYDNETGFYYLQSRYYDPAVGRFVNLDAFVSTGTGFGGFNMFAYCNNNPVMYVDPTGNFTFGISLNANVTCFFGASISIGIFGDDNGNFDIQWSYSVPFTESTMIGVLDAGVGAAVQFTNADTVYDLYGPSTIVGASGGPSWYVGGDVISFDGEAIDGCQITAGVGAGLDVHYGGSTTSSVLPQNNKKSSSAKGVSWVWVAEQIIYPSLPKTIK